MNLSSAFVCKRISWVAMTGDTAGGKELKFPFALILAISSGAALTGIATSIPLGKALPG